MRTSPKEPFRVNVGDPKAPKQEEWDAMAPPERARVVAELPAEVPLALHPPEGDAHRIPKNRVTDALDRFFRRIGRGAYVSSELATFYPGESMFCPDVLAVFDVARGERSKWVVSAEGRGLDWVLEVHSGGDRAKDFDRNVELYARLGIPEYFIFDRTQLRLHGFRLPARGGGAGRVYQRVVPQAGKFASAVLGLELMVVGTGVRFFYGDAPIPELDEVVDLLETTINDVMSARDDAERRAAEMAHDLEAEVRRAEAETLRAHQEAERAHQEAERAHQEAERAERAEARVAELEALMRAAEPSRPAPTKT